MDQETIRQILGAWAISAEPVRETIGHDKETWRVGDKHWLSGIATTQQSRFAYIQSLLDQTPLQGYQTPQAIPTSTGHDFTTAHKKIWYLTSHIDGRQPEPTSHSDMTSVTSALATLHSQLHDTLPPADAGTTAPLTHLKASAKLLATRKLPYSPDQYDTLRQGLEYLQTHPVPTQHAQLIHGDPSYPNLKLGPDNELTGILDWDSTTTASPLYDLAVIGQTILYRSNADDPLRWLDDLLSVYSQSGGHQYSRQELLCAVLSIKYESINHHGQKYLDGGCSFDLTYSQVAKIHTVLALARRGQ